MERVRRESDSSTVTSLVAVGMVVGALYFGKDVLVPFALALFVSFVLTPPVVLLERLKFGRVPSVFLVLTLAVSATVAILWLGTTQLTDILIHLPQYQQNITKKIEAMRNPAGYGLTKAIDSLQQLSKVLVQEKAPKEDLHVHPEPRGRRLPVAAAAQPKEPITVEVKPADPGVVQSLKLVGSPMLRCLEEAAAVLIFTLFMLMQRGDLRNRLLRLCGERHLNLMTTAMDDAAQRVSRYLLTQLIVNGVFGLVLGTGLYFIGVPNAPFWGVLGSILRFIPYVGTVVAGLCPLILSLAVFEGWGKPLLTFGLFATVEMLTSAAIEPWLYGVRTGVSSLAILMSAAFWTLLWGPIGLILSTPLTVCLVVLGRYVPPVQFLGLMLGDEPVLPPEARFYQRLLAMDEDEALDVAETYWRENNKADLYDCVLVPALSLAERDRHQNTLEPERETFVYRTTKNFIEDISEQHWAAAEPVTNGKASFREGMSILCIPARDEADELVCLMLSDLLRQSGFHARSICVETVESMIASIREQKPDILFVSALPPFGISQTRALCRRIRPSFPDMKILIGFWQSAAEVEKVKKRLGSDCFDAVLTSLKQADAQVRLYAELTADTPVQADAQACKSTE